MAEEEGRGRSGEEGGLRARFGFGSDHNGEGGRNANRLDKRLLHLMLDGRSALARFSRALMAASARAHKNAQGLIGRDTSSIPAPSAVAGSESFFPALCPYPARRVEGTCSGRLRYRCRGWRRAENLTNMLFCAFSFWECGAPYRQQEINSIVDNIFSRGFSPMSLSFATNLSQELLPFARLPDGLPSASRGVTALNEALELLRADNYDSLDVQDINRLSNHALEVFADRIALPEEAGTVNPADILKGHQLDVFNNMSETVPQCKVPCPGIRACHRVPPGEKHKVNKRLLSSRMAVLVPFETALRDTLGNVITGGLFCVKSKPLFDRLINDRRPFNAVEDQLGWAELPQGCMYCQAVLGPGDSIRGSGDDLSNYFYMLQHHPNWIPRNVVGDGKPLSGKDYVEFGAECDRSYLLAIRVVCMGDVNAVDLCQSVHEQVLHDCDCLREAETLKYRHSVPLTPVWDGLYIDDHIVSLVVNRQEHPRVRRPRQQLRDEKIMTDSREHYEQVGLPRSLAKTFDKQPEFTAWGTHINNRTGRVGTALPKLAAIANVCALTVETGHASQKAMQQLLGQFPHPFMHRRELMSVFQGSYKWTSSIDPNSIRKLPSTVRDELVCACLLLGVAHANIRWPVLARVSATDATPTAGGSAMTETTGDIAQNLYRLGEHRGEHVRLDWSNENCLPPESSMQKLQPDIQKLMLAHKWKATKSYKFSQESHVNLQEMRAFKAELKTRSLENLGGSRCINLVDSRVVLGAWSKGRSSSVSLNPIMRSCLGYVICGQVKMINVWVDTHSNPADEPSRFKPIAAPSPCPAWLLEKCNSLDSIPEGLSHLVRVEKGVFVPRVPVGPVCPAGGPCGSSHGVFVSSQSHRLTQSPPRADMSPRTARAFREIFSGKGVTSKVFRKSGQWCVLAGVEAFPRGVYDPFSDIMLDDVFVNLKREASEAVNNHWHFATPCSSFSLLQNLNGGSRTKQLPQGDGSLDREILGNELLRRSLVLIRLLAKGGNTWSLENPGTSYLFHMPSVKQLMSRVSVSVAILDQCMFGLRFQGAPRSRRVRKYTKIIGNLDLSSLSLRCNRKHEHDQVIGSIMTKTGRQQRSALAAVYPLALCRMLELAARRAH